jgi:hypothetical protein
MMRFSTVRLEGDYVRVSGPVMMEFGTEMRHIHFALAQTGVMVEGEGQVADGGEGWTGQADRGGLEAAPAVAFGAATLVTGGWRSLQTFTWFERLDITE